MAGFLETLRNFGKENIPSNIRLFSSTMMGNRELIDESYFPQKDLDAMRMAAQAGLLRRNDAISDASILQQIYANQPPKDTAYTSWKQNGETLRVSMGQRAQEAATTLSQLRATPQTIQYEDYPEKATERFNNLGWVETLRNSVSNPSFRAATSIGQAIISKDADGNLILEDSYDWNANKLLKRASYADLATMIVTNLHRPKNLGNILGNAMAPTENIDRRKVRINLGK